MSRSHFQRMFMAVAKPASRAVTNQVALRARQTGPVSTLALSSTQVRAISGTAILHLASRPSADPATRTDTRRVSAPVVVPRVQPRERLGRLQS